MKKSKTRVVLMVALAMLLQIIGPAAQSVYAEIAKGPFSMTERPIGEDGIARLDWEFALDSNNRVVEYTYIGSFTLENKVPETDLIAEDDEETVIGSYSISTDGEVTVKINRDLYEGLEDKEEETSTVPEDETEETDDTEVEDTLTEKENEELQEEKVEGEEASDGEETPSEGREPTILENEEISFIGKTSAMLASATDNLGDLFVGDEEAKVVKFTGTMEVGGASEKVKPTIMARLGVTSEGNDLGEIFEFEFFRLGGKDGTNINEGEIIEIGPDTIVTLGYKWDTQGLDAKNGDTATIQLPDVFKAMDITTPQNIIVEGTIVGTYTIIGSELRFIFNENIEIAETKNGFVNLGLEFNLEKFEENIEQEIEFNDKKNTTLKVIAKPSGDIRGIDKEGHPDKKHDAKEITWTIDIINTSDKEITNATVKDIIPDGLGSPRDFKVNELIIGLEGDKSLGSSVTVAPNMIDNEFSIGFNNIAPYKGYRIVYTTTIEDYSKDTFTNDATFSMMIKNYQQMLQWVDLQEVIL
ncbi:hypothetical protein CIW83_14565 [Tissierella sp. P1]|uniref:collagen binding domain-containing protein n=1 Tax=Tissierella sp. P1 TaxID=1280483 RepID=UPI000BA11D24|nr:collagen binding domain-containing protein [Tissierella sp. P1]OZV11498.1 hypothetical protein CIW83_14565 [Tissierella sp. P1]